MASAYMGSSGGGAAIGKPASASSIGSIDDLPVFGGGGFSEPAVIVPTARAGANNKMLYIMIAAVGLLAVVAIVMVAAQIYITGAVDSWTLQGSFGQRRFVALTPLLTLGMAALFASRTSGVVFPEDRRKTTPEVLGRVVLVALVLLCVWWNVGLIVQFGMHRMDRQRLTLGANAWNTFVVLPREAPGILIRYFTDRSSFYEKPQSR